MATLRKRGTKWHAQVRRSGQQAHTRSFTHKIEAGREQEGSKGRLIEEG